MTDIHKSVGSNFLDMQGRKQLSKTRRLPASYAPDMYLENSVELSFSLTDMYVISILTWIPCQIQYQNPPGR